MLYPPVSPGGMDEPTLTDLSTREEAEEEIDFEKGEVALGLRRVQWAVATRPVRSQTSGKGSFPLPKEEVFSLVALKKWLQLCTGGQSSVSVSCEAVSTTAGCG